MFLSFLTPFCIIFSSMLSKDSSILTLYMHDVRMRFEECQEVHILSMPPFLPLPFFLPPFFPPSIHPSILSSSPLLPFLPPSLHTSFHPSLPPSILSSLPSSLPLSFPRYRFLSILHHVRIMDKIKIKRTIDRCFDSCNFYRYSIDHAQHCHAHKHSSSTGTA